MEKISRGQPEKGDLEFSRELRAKDFNVGVIIKEVVTRMIGILLVFPREIL